LISDDDQKHIGLTEKEMAHTQRPSSWRLGTIRRQKIKRTKTSGQKDYEVRRRENINAATGGGRGIIGEQEALTP